MSTYRFRAQALTPIHVGSGTEIDPTQFLIENDHLIWFNVAELIDKMNAQEIERFSAVLERADLKEIQNVLRHQVNNTAQPMPQIQASKAFLSEFALKASSPSSRFRVDMMPRNVHTGTVFIPGSSIKGAIRTAVINHFANMDAGTRPVVHNAVSNAPIREKGAVLEEAALNRRFRETEKDVFRLVKVSDCELPDESTRIDRVRNINPGKFGSESIAMWMERTLSMADTWQPPEFSVTICIDERAMGNDLVKSRLGRLLDIDLLISASNHFYWNRMIAEGNRFDSRENGGTGWQTLYSLFPRGQMEDRGEVFIIDPLNLFWDNASTRKRRMLLRLGRFSHFESLSADELRQGYNVKARRPILGMGATRTRCVMENGKPPMPFGWLLMTLDT